MLGCQRSQGHLCRSAVTHMHPPAHPPTQVQQLSALAGIQLAGNGLLSGEAGLYLAGSSSAIEEISMTPSPAPLLAVEATFQVAPVVAMRPSPFA